MSNNALLLLRLYHTYRKWHPWQQASCGHHGEHARGR
jgi:hypothetical protein